MRGAVGRFLHFPERLDSIRPPSSHRAEEPIPGHWIYTLGYPNHEVESSLNVSLLSVYTDDPSRSFAHRLRLLDLWPRI